MQDPSSYCRDIEAYLCRKNEGHLIRIVGPAFERVCGWRERGVPLKIAFRGIDRYCDRYYAKGPRRRPVRIEFCEADVLDAFDEWRRAVGVSASGPEDAPERSARKPALASHLERVSARLSALRARGTGSPEFVSRIDAALREMQDMAAGAKHARGSVRSAMVDRLGQLDTALLDAAIAELDPAVTQGLRREAADELAPFAGRMVTEARTQALEAAFRRLAREAAGLPVIAFD